MTRHAQYTDHRERHTSGGADFITGLGHERQCHLQKDRPAGGAGFRDQIVRPCDALLESSSAAIHRTDTLFLWGPGPPRTLPSKMMSCVILKKLFTRKREYEPQRQAHGREAFVRAGARG